MGGGSPWCSGLHTGLRHRSKRVRTYGGFVSVLLFFYAPCTSIFWAGCVSWNVMSEKVKVTKKPVNLLRFNFIIKVPTRLEGRSCLSRKHCFYGEVHILSPVSFVLGKLFSGHAQIVLLVKGILIFIFSYFMFLYLFCFILCFVFCFFIFYFIILLLFSWMVVTFYFLLLFIIQSPQTPIAL